MKSLLYIFFLAVNWTIFFNIAFGNMVFRSCEEALTTTSSSGEYNVQPRPGGKVSSVTCNILNDTHGILFLGNSREKEFHLENDITYEWSLYHDKITYGNYDAEDMDEFLKSAGTCSQSMYIKNRGVNVGWQKYIFWDGTFYEGSNSFQNDGICKCVVKQVCDEKQNSAAECNAYKEKTTTWYEDSGEFSVLPERLPIKEIRTGDVEEEGMKYSVSKLSCTFLLRDKKKLKRLEDNLCINVKVLIDENIQSCITFKEKSAIYGFNSDTNFTKVKFFTEEGNCSSKILPFVPKGKNYEACENTKNCEYSCSPSTILYFQIALEDKEELSVCEFILE